MQCNPKIDAVSSKTNGEQLGVCMVLISYVERLATSPVCAAL